MNLGIDPGMAACGWAVIEPPTADAGVRLVAIGVITTEHNGAIARNLDHQRRIAIVGRELAGVVAKYGVTKIAAEDYLSHGNIHAVLPQALCWGAIAQLAAAAGVELRAVVAEDWQHGVAPGVAKLPKKQRYPLVEKKLRRFVGDVALASILPELHTHALDGFGVAAYAAVRRSPARRVWSPVAGSPARVPG